VVATVKKEEKGGTRPSQQELLGTEHYKKRIEELLEKIERMQDLMTVQTTLERAALGEPTDPQKLIHLNRGLIHVLQVIQNSPTGRISTRQLLREVNSDKMHKLLKKAEDLGLIDRSIEPMPQGQKGGKMTINYLTPLGEEVLRYVKEHSTES
jgi:hypothetical protein